MNCDEVRELLAAYALDALTADEHAAVRDHLEECALHPELTALRATVRTLPALAGELEPPAALRTRVLAIATAPRPSSAPPVRLEARRRRPFMPLALAAALATLALALGWWVTARDTEAPLLVREATATAGAAQGRVTYAPEARRLSFAVEGLAPAPAGQDYQLWVIRGGTPVSLGVFNTSTAGRGELTVDTALAEGETVAVTLEPRGGSAAPTSAPFLAIRI